MKKMFWGRILLVSVVVISGFLTWFFWPGAIDNDQESPPEFVFSEASFQGLIKMESGLLKFEESDVAVHQNFIQEKGFQSGDAIDLAKKLNFYYVEKDTPLVDLIKGIDPQASKLLFVYYSPGQEGSADQPGFYLYPKAPAMPDSVKHKMYTISNEADFVIKKGRGFLLYAAKDSKAYGFKTIYQQPNYTADFVPLALGKKGWILMAPGKNAYSEVVAAYKDRLISAWSFQDGEFVKIADNHVFAGAYLMWVRLAETPEAVVGQTGNDAPPEANQCKKNDECSDGKICNSGKCELEVETVDFNSSIEGEAREAFKVFMEATRQNKNTYNCSGSTGLAIDAGCVSSDQCNVKSNGKMSLKKDDEGRDFCFCSDSSLFEVINDDGSFGCVEQLSEDQMIARAERAMSGGASGTYGRAAMERHGDDDEYAREMGRVIAEKVDGVRMGRAENNKAISCISRGPEDRAKTNCFTSEGTEVRKGDSNNAVRQADAFDALLAYARDSADKSRGGGSCPVGQVNSVGECVAASECESRSNAKVRSIDNVNYCMCEDGFFALSDSHKKVQCVDNVNGIGSQMREDRVNGLRAGGREGDWNRKAAERNSKQEGGQLYAKLIGKMAMEKGVVWCKADTNCTQLVVVVNRDGDEDSDDEYIHNAGISGKNWGTGPVATEGATAGKPVVGGEDLIWDDSFKVAATAPVEGATALPSISEIWITFTEEVDPNSIDKTDFTITNMHNFMPEVVIEEVIVHGELIRLLIPGLNAGISHKVNVVAASFKSTDGSKIQGFSWTFDTIGKPPATPSDLGVKQGYDEAVLIWADEENENVTSYQIYVGDDILKTVPKNAAKAFEHITYYPSGLNEWHYGYSIVSSDLPDSSELKLKVRGCIQNSCSGFSNVVTFKPFKLSPPLEVNLQVLGGNNHAKLYFNEPSEEEHIAKWLVTVNNGADQYFLKKNICYADKLPEKSNDKCFDKSFMNIDGMINIKILGLSNGSKNDLVVVPENIYGIEGPPYLVLGVTPAGVPSTPSLKVDVDTNYSTVNVSWDLPSGNGAGVLDFHLLMVFTSGAGFSGNGSKYSNDAFDKCGYGDFLGGDNVKVVEKSFAESKLNYTYTGNFPYKSISNYVAHICLLARNKAGYSLPAKKVRIF